MSETLQVLGETVATALEGAVLATEVGFGELCCRVEREALARVLSLLRDDPRFAFDVLCDLCGVDYPDRAMRFEVVYNLLSTKHNRRIRLKVETDEETPVPSAVPIYSSAGWWEREAWDLFGIYFSDHPDLRRLLTDYGFEGHPLRKDFPLTGYVELRYDEERKRVVYEPVRLTQEFRNFEFLSPWEGMDKLLPGDEKAGDEKAGNEKSGEEKSGSEKSGTEKSGDGRPEDRK